MNHSIGVEFSIERQAIALGFKKMAGMLRSCIQSSLKLSNSVVAMSGIAMVLYGLWMIRVLHRESGFPPFEDSDYPNPWFIYTFLGFGVVVCLIALSGHIAAETSNGCCLYVYLAFLCLLLLLEAGLTVDVLINPTWEEDFPFDPTRNLYKLQDFIAKNFDFCKWIGLSIVSAQGLSFLFAITLKALRPPREILDDTDDEEFADSRVSLLRNFSHPRVLGNPVYSATK